MTIFISGKITDNPNYKEHFDKAEKQLKELGIIPINPTILPLGLTNAEYMKIGLSMLENCDGIYMLSNWQNSKGAKIEYEYANYLNKHIYFEEQIQSNIFDKEEIYNNCTVQILSNSVTGEQSIGWWQNEEK